MSRKHYEAIAGALRLALDDHAQPSARAGIAYAAVRVADALAADSPRFDRERFLAAAVGTPSTEEA